MIIQNKKLGFVSFDVTTYELLQDAVLPEKNWGVVENIQQTQLRLLAVVARLLEYVPREDLLDILGTSDDLELLPEDYPRPRTTHRTNE